ncbi:hypothetical protein ACFQ9X_36615 [Catenulispora yoronensis]
MGVSVGGGIGVSGVSVSGGISVSGVSVSVGGGIGHGIGGLRGSGPAPIMT